MGHLTILIVSILDVDLALEVLHRLQVAVGVIGIAQAVPIRVFYGGEVVSVIGKRDGPALAVRDGGHIALGVVGQLEGAGYIGYPGHSVSDIAVIYNIAIRVDKLLDLTV